MDTEALVCIQSAEGLNVHSYYESRNQSPEAALGVIMRAHYNELQLELRGVNDGVFALESCVFRNIAALGWDIDSVVTVDMTDGHTSLNLPPIEQAIPNPILCANLFAQSMHNETIQILGKYGHNYEGITSMSTLAEIEQLIPRLIDKHPDNALALSDASNNLKYIYTALQVLNAFSQE